MVFTSLHPSAQHCCAFPVPLPESHPCCASEPAGVDPIDLAREALGLVLLGLHLRSRES